MSGKVKLLLALVVAVVVYRMVSRGGESTIEVDYDVAEA